MSNVQRNKGKRSSLRPERLAAIIALGLLAFLLLFLNGGALIALRKVNGWLETDLENRLLTVGRAAVAAIEAENYLVLRFRDSEGDLDLDLVKSWRGDSSYAALLTLLSGIKEAAELRSISLITPDSRVIADPDDPDIIGDTRVLFLLDEKEIEAASKGTPATSPLYPVEEILYKRVYIPVPDDNQSIHALLRLEAGSDYFKGLHRLEGTLPYLLSGSTLILLLVSWILYRLIGGLLEAERTISQEDRLRSLGTLAAGLAHEIRNPLSIIQLICEELRTALSTSEKRTAPPTKEISSQEGEDLDGLVEDIQGEVKRLESLVEQFLSIARPDAANHTFVPGKPAAPVERIHQVTRLFEKGLKTGSVRLQLDLPKTEVGRVTLNEKDFNQVLLNLLRNASAACSEKGGVITLRIRSDEAKKEVSLILEDTGSGMPESVRRRAFEPFFTTNEGGTGLGLPLVRRLVEAAGGRVDLKDNPGGGTRVIVVLPQSPDSPESPAPDSSRC